MVADAGFNRREEVEELRRTTDKPVTAAIYTHGHGDHVFTGARFAQIAGLQTHVNARGFAPEHTAGRAPRRRYMETLLAEDRCLMSRGVWHHFAGPDRAFTAKS